MRKQILVLGIALGLSACSEMKKVDEMKDATSEMNQTTKTLLDKTGEMKDGLDKMSKTTEEMGETTDDLRTLTRDELLTKLDETNAATATLLDAMRQGDTANLRAGNFQQILQQKSLQSRVSKAGIYLMGFEFQVLGTVGKDKDPAFREMLYHQAMLEFFLNLDEIAPKNGEVWPDAHPDLGDSDENRASAFNSIAFGLHKLNRQQLPDPAYGRPLSVYDLIVIALKLKPEIESGRIVLPAGPHFIKEVLARPERVRQLLQTRYNMFAYALVGLTTNLAESSWTMRLVRVLAKLNIDVSEGARGSGVGEYLLDEVLQPAVRTTEDMISIGLTPKFTKTTRLILWSANVNFLSKDVRSLAPNSVRRERELESLWSQYRAPVKSYEPGRR